jgi:hypothetical protein
MATCGKLSLVMPACAHSARKPSNSRWPDRPDWTPGASGADRPGSAGFNPTESTRRLHTVGRDAGRHSSDADPLAEPNELRIVIILQRAFRSGFSGWRVHSWEGAVEALHAIRPLRRESPVPPQTPRDLDADPAEPANHVVQLRVADIHFGDLSPRKIDKANLARLAAADPDLLPPILVDAASMDVVDGAHRLTLALDRGQESIAAIMFHGSRREARIEAIARNVGHGKPLTANERRRSAEGYYAPTTRSPTAR